jgi:cell wall-associated NlpC family hydrolase
LVVPERGQAQARSAPAPGKPSTYTVKRGDTLGAIARRHGISVAALARENDIRNPHRIRQGQELCIPQKVAQAPSLRTKGLCDEAAAENDSGDALVDTALGYRGVPYRWAGMTTRGMDCSGLVARVLLSHGIRAPHSSRELYKLGTAVSRDQLRAGDLVFFNTRGRGISHVGIYVDDGKFVHASSSGGKVETDRLDTGYYQRQYVGARRVM